MKILVVDDSDDARLLLTTTLRAEGYAVEATASAEEALALAHQSPPQLIISDVLLPEMDGFALCRQIKQDSRLKAIPFVFYTATFVDPADARFARDLGASRYIIKPVSTDAFLSSIREVLEELHDDRLAIPEPRLLDEQELRSLHEQTLLRKLDRKVHELEAERRALRDSEERYRRLVDDAPDAILIHDFSGRIRFVNAAGARLLGVGSPEELRGKALPDLVSPEDRPSLQRALAAVAKGGATLPLLRFRLPSRADGLRTVEANGSVLLYDDQQAVQVILRDITGQLAAESALHQAAEVVAESPAVLFRWGAEAGWPVRYVSPNIAYFGYRPDDFADGPTLYRDMLHPDDRERIAREVQEHTAAGRARFRQEYRLLAPDGRIFWVDGRTTLERDADGKVLHYQGVVVDITARKKTEQRLAHRLEMERLVGTLSARFVTVRPEALDAAITDALEGLGTFIGAERAYLMRLTKDGRRMAISHQWCAPSMLRLDKRRHRIASRHFPWFLGQLQQLRPVLIGQPADLPAAAAAEQTLFRRLGLKSLLAIPVAFEGKLLGYLGFETVQAAKRWDHEDVALLAPTADAISGALEHAEARRELVDSERRYRQLVDSAPLALGVLDAAGRLRFANAAMDQLLAGEQGRVEGRVFSDFLSQPEREVFARNLAAATKGQPAPGREYRFRRLDGRRGWMECTLHPITFEGGPAVQLLARDITQRQQDEEALRMADMVVENSPVIAYRVRGDGAVEYVSSNIERFGFKTDELLSGKEPLTALIHPDDRSRALAETHRHLAANTPTFRREYRVVGRNGVVRWVDDRTTVIREGDGRGVHLQGVLTDVTDHVEAEARMQRANRALRTLSQCNASLVHAQDEAALLRSVCRTLVETGGYRLAWVGYREGGRLRKKSEFGRDSDLVDHWVRLHQRFNGAGSDPADIAIDTGEAYVEQHLTDNAGMNPWLKLAAENGIHSLIALPLHLDEQVLGALCVLSEEADAFDLTEMRLLLELADDVAFGVISQRTGAERIQLEKARRHSAEQLQRNLVETIQAMALALEKRDPYTAGHQQRVSQLATAIAKRLKLNPDRIEGIRLGAMIHDIGKIAVPSEILNRPGHLALLERQLIGGHPAAGYDIIKGVAFPWPLAEMVLEHHERLDGSGYPQGLRDGQIILEARILAVADVVEAMASHRPYRPGLGMEAALQEIDNHRGTLYDTDVVNACLALFREGDFHFEDTPVPGGDWTGDLREQVAKRAEEARH